MNSSSISVSIPSTEFEKSDISPSLGSASQDLPTSLEDPEKSQICEEEQDGGLRAWLVVLGGFLIMSTTIGYAETFAVFEDYFVRAGVASASRVSWIGSVQGFMMLLMTFPAGYLFDLGYCRAILIFGTVFFVFSLFMASLVDLSRYDLLLLAMGFGAGIGLGFASLPAVATQSHYWNKRRPLAIGIVMTGCPIGGIVYPLILNHLIHGRVGYVWAVRIVAFVALAVLLVASALMVPRPPKLEPGKRPPLRELLRDQSYMLLIVGVFFVFMAFSFSGYYLQLDAILHGVSPKITYYAVSITHAASFFGRVFPALFTRAIGLFNSCIVNVLLLGISTFLMYGVSKAVFVLLTAIVHGLLLGMWATIPILVLTSMAKDPNEIGIRIGFFFAISGVGSLVGPPIEGLLVGPHYEWSRGILFSALVTISAGIYLFIPRFFIARKQNTWKV